MKAGGSLDYHRLNDRGLPTFAPVVLIKRKEVHNWVTDFPGRENQFHPGSEVKPSSFIL